MQVLKDAATLAVLILLALTVRIDIDGAPLEFDFTPPVDAAESQASNEQPEAASPDSVEGPAAAAAPQAARLATIPGSQVAPVRELRRIPDITHRVERLLLLEANGHRFEIVVDGEELIVPSRPESLPTKPCSSLLDPQLAS